MKHLSRVLMMMVAVSVLLTASGCAGNKYPETPAPCTRVVKSLVNAATVPCDDPVPLYFLFD